MLDQFPALLLLYYSSILTHLRIEVSFLNSSKMDSATTKDSDKELLAKLYHESKILKCKSNQVKRDKWKKIAEKYSQEKNIPLIDHKTLARKWSRMVTAAQKKRSNAKKDARATGGGPSTVRLDTDNELILSAAEANADLPSTTDCEPHLEPNDVEVEEESQSLLHAAQNAVDNEVADLSRALSLPASGHDEISRMEEFSQDQDPLHNSDEFIFNFQGM